MTLFEFLGFFFNNISDKIFCFLIRYILFKIFLLFSFQLFFFLIFKPFVLLLKHSKVHKIYFRRLTEKLPFARLPKISRRLSVQNRHLQIVPRYIVRNQRFRIYRLKRHMRYIFRKENPRLVSKRLFVLAFLLRLQNFLHVDLAAATYRAEARVVAFPKHVLFCEVEAGIGLIRAFLVHGPGAFIVDALMFAVLFAGLRALENLVQPPLAFRQLLEALDFRAEEKNVNEGVGEAGVDNRVAAELLDGVVAQGGVYEGAEVVEASEGHHEGACGL